MMNFKKISTIALLASVIGTGELFAMDATDERGNSATITIQPSFTDQNNDSNTSGNLGASVSPQETLESLLAQEEILRARIQLLELQAKKKELLQRQEEEKSKNVNGVANVVAETPKVEEEKTKSINTVTETPKAEEEKIEDSEIQNTPQSEKQKLSTTEKVARESGRVIGQIETVGADIKKEGKRVEKKVKKFAKDLDRARKKEKRKR